MKALSILLPIIINNAQLGQLKHLQIKAVQQEQLREEIAQRLGMLDTYDEGAIYAIAQHYQLPSGPLMEIRQGLEGLLRRELSRLDLAEENDASIETAIWEDVG
jgi:hypothetical protein